MGNPWMDHVQATRKANAGKSFKEVLVLAGKTYKKGSAPSTSSTKKKRASKRKGSKSRKAKKSRRVKK